MERRLPRREDPLGDVIKWLDEADLGEEAYSIQSICGGDSLGNVRELFAETPDEGTAASLGASRDRSSALRHLPLSRATRLPPSETPASLPVNSILARGADTTLCCGSRVNNSKSFLSLDSAENEDEEWDNRLKQTGAAGRLLVYEKNERPQEDFLLRGGGTGRRIMVASVVEHGKAAKAGVKAGDVLVSINGKKDFLGQTADFVHSNLFAPVMLVFMGFVGKLQAEVRLNYSVPLAGVAPHAQVIRMQGSASPRVQVVDEVIFQPSAAPLLLVMHSEAPSTSKENFALPSSPLGSTSIDLDTLEPNPRPSVDPLGSGVQVAGDQSDRSFAAAFESRENTITSSLAYVDEGPQPLSVYELRVHDAKNLVQRAMSRVRAKAALDEKFRATASWDGADHPMPHRISPKVFSKISGTDGFDHAQLVRATSNHVGQVTRIDFLPHERSNREMEHSELRRPLDEHNVHLEYETPAAPNISLEMADVPMEFDTFNFVDLNPKDESPPSMRAHLPAKNASSDTIEDGENSIETDRVAIDIDTQTVRSVPSELDLAQSPLLLPFPAEPPEDEHSPESSPGGHSSMSESLPGPSFASLDRTTSLNNVVDIKRIMGNAPLSDWRSPSQSRMSSRRCEAPKNPEEEERGPSMLCEV